MPLGKLKTGVSLYIIRLLMLIETQLIWWA